MNNLNISDIFDINGPLALGKEDYKVREGQIEMAYAVRTALELHQHLIVEAGTGVGKSFAELIPTMIRETPLLETEKTIEFDEEGNYLEEPIIETEVAKSPVIIGTYTNALSKQLFEDAQVINDTLGLDRKVVIAKGAGNYLSPKELRKFSSKTILDEEQEKELIQIQKWSEKTKTGDINELPERPSFWSSISCEDCTVSQCLEEKCFLSAAKERVKEADIIITNHMLIGIQYLLNDKVFPVPSGLILDEAHDFPKAIRSLLDVQLTYNSMSNFVEQVRQKWGTEIRIQDKEDEESIDDILISLVAKYTDFLEDQYKQKKEYIKLYLKEKYEDQEIIKLKEKPEFLNGINEVVQLLDLLLKQSVPYGLKQKTRKMKRRCESMITDDENYLLWSEIRKKDDKGHASELRFKSSPIMLDGILGNKIFAIQPTIFTSATLSTTVNNRKTTSYIQKQLGLNIVKNFPIIEKFVKSPFNYKNQCSIHLHPDVPDPRIYSPNPEKYKNYYRSVASRILTYGIHRDGGKLVLFTSYKDLLEVKALCEPILQEHKIPLFYQDNDRSKEYLLQEFKKHGGLLFGVKSFWQGIDLPGEQCSHVIIVKIPFHNQTDLLTEAIIHKIEERGDSMWADYLIPEMLLSVKQGTGRLIRTETDKGTMVILDSRIFRVGYGKQVIEVLPEAAPIYKIAREEGKLIKGQIR